MVGRKHYLGDGVYAENDAGHLVLTTEDGYRETNRIVLDDAVFASLLELLGLDVAARDAADDDDAEGA